MDDDWGYSYDSGHHYTRKIWNREMERSNPPTPALRLVVLGEMLLGFRTKPSEGSHEPVGKHGSGKWTFG